MKISRTISVSAGLLAASSVASYILGLLRDRLLAGHFGAGPELDVFNASFLIPDAIMTLFGAALTTAFIPVFTAWLHKHGEKEAWHLTNTVLRIITIFIMLAVVSAWLLLPWLTPLITPGFDGERNQLLIQTTRIMLISPILFSMSVLFGSALQGMRRFISYALSPVLYNLGIIFGIVVLSEPFGIQGVVVGVICGALLHMLVRMIELRSTGWTWMAVKTNDYGSWKHEGIKKIVRLMIPRVIGLLLWQANLWFFTAVASGLLIGSITVFNLARNFQSLPVSFFGIALATVMFPALASSYARQKNQEFVNDLSKGIKQLLFFTIPAALGLMLLAIPLVDVFLGTGKFSQTAVLTTGITLSVFALSIPFESLQHILARAFYAQHDTITPVFITIIATATNICVSLLTVKYIYVSGLALGFVSFSIIQVVLLLLLLRRKTSGLNGGDIMISLGRIIPASAIMGVCVYSVTTYVQNSSMALATGALAGTIVYVIMAALLRMPELSEAVRLTKRLIRKS